MPRAAYPPKLAERTYLSLRFGAPAPFEYLVWRLAPETGWTLDYIESLTMQQWHDYLQIRDAKAKAGVK